MRSASELDELNHILPNQKLVELAIKMEQINPKQKEATSFGGLDIGCIFLKYMTTPSPPIPKFPGQISVLEGIKKYIEIGVTHFILHFIGLDETTLKLFDTKIIRNA